mmetsp:Transcript_13169/g.33413  ORF Transcript_13169/g.33413 Transcript_13169/m.33413 type:complete len:218 (+) Transcript_13169:3442-4095(+)
MTSSFTGVTSFGKDFAKMRRTSDAISATASKNSPIIQITHAFASGASRPPDGCPSPAAASLSRIAATLRRLNACAAGLRCRILRSTTTHSLTTSGAHDFEITPISARMQRADTAAWSSDSAAAMFPTARAAATATCFESCSRYVMSSSSTADLESRIPPPVFLVSANTFALRHTFPRIFTLSADAGAASVASTKNSRTCGARTSGAWCATVAQKRRV